MELSFEVDVEEIVDSCNTREINHLIEYLIKKNYIDKTQILSKISKTNMHDELWDETILKLRESRLLLSSSQTSLIERIVKNLP